MKASTCLRAISGMVGFILSPLSWWNDLLVNVPLSYAFAWSTGKFLNLFIVVPEWLFVNLFIFGYFLSNLIGFVLIHYGLFGIKKDKKTSLRKMLIVSAAYSLIVLAFFQLNFCDPAKACRVFPDWVRP